MTGVLFVLASLVAAFSTSVGIDNATLEPLGGGYYPSVSGIPSVPGESGVLRPVQTIFVPVPPGVAPVLEYRVDRVNATGWDGLAWAMEPTLEGSGLRAREVHSATVSVSSSEPVTMKVIPLAGTTVAMITFDPFCYGDLSRYASRVQISLSWPESPGARSLEGSLLEGVAPGGTVWWRRRSRSPESPFWGRPWARIRIEHSGFYAITGQQLQEAGCPVVGMPSASLAMLSGPGVPFAMENPADHHLPTQVALSVSDGGDGVFGPQDTLFFYGQGLLRPVAQDDSLSRTWHRYDDANTYWLTWGGEAGLRMETVNASYQGHPFWGGTASQLVWLEQDYTWFPEEDRTGWCWAPIQPNTPSTIFFTPPSGSTGRALRVSILHDKSFGYASDSIVLNGTAILDTAFVKNRYIYLWSVTDPPLSTGMNTLRIWSKNVHGGSAFNYFELELDAPVGPGRQLFLLNRTPGFYTLDVPGVLSGARVFQTTAPFNPVELVDWGFQGGVARLSADVQPGASVWVVNPEDWKTPVSIQPAQPGRIVGSGIQGDVLILVPEHLWEHARGFEAVYGARGFSVAMATYREVYDEFNQGVESPGAVRSMVRHALDYWDDPPQALLLVGSSNYDPLGHTTGSRPPAPLWRTIGSSSTRSGAGDDGFVTVHEGAVLPEIPVSRIPVSTGQQLQAYLLKLFSYQHALTGGGSWLNRVVLAADDEWNDASTWDVMATLSSEHLANNVVPFSMEVEKVYLIDYPWPPGTSPGGVHPEKPEARADFVQAINSGASSVLFFGHGSYNQIAQENLFSALDLPSLNNHPRYPVMFFASCNTGQFDMLGTSCLSEELVNHPSGGGIVSIGSSDVSFAGQNNELLSFFMDSMYGPHRMWTGKALWNAKILMSGYAVYNYYYNAMGDGGVTPPMSEDTGKPVVLPAGGLLRGRLNTAEVEFPSRRTAEVAIAESGDSVLYTSPFSPYVEIPWVRLGQTAYQGMVETESDGRATISFFMPIQSDTGSLARAHALGAHGSTQQVAWNQWAAVADSGGYSPDSIGPSISLTCRKVGDSHILTAALEDESGISVFGDHAGRALLLSINSQGFDVSRYFQYLPGSHTRGILTYPLPELGAGGHRLILAAWDGMGNGSRDTLDITISEGSEGILDRVAVYPNPGSGTRAFIFETNQPGLIRVKVFTVAGRPLWQGQTSHSGGSGQLIWSGLDADGDRPAAGAYIYIVTLETPEGAASRRGFLAVSPEN
jgi:hypothetical protein